MTFPVFVTSWTHTGGPGGALHSLILVPCVLGETLHKACSLHVPVTALSRPHTKQLSVPGPQSGQVIWTFTWLIP